MLQTVAKLGCRWKQILAAGELSQDWGGLG